MSNSYPLHCPFLPQLQPTISQYLAFGIFLNLSPYLNKTQRAGMNNIERKASNEFPNQAPVYWIAARPLMARTLIQRTARLYSQQPLTRRIVHMLVPGTCLLRSRKSLVSKCMIWGFGITRKCRHHSHTKDHCPKNRYNPMRFGLCAPSVPKKPTATNGALMARGGSLYSGNKLPLFRFTSSL